MAHVFIGHHYIILSRHVVGQIVIHDQSQQSIQQGWIYLLIDLVHLCLQKDS